MFDYLHLYSIPNPVNLTQIPKNPILVMGSDRYGYPQEPCNFITDNINICSHLEMQEIENSEDCIIQLIKHNMSPKNCKLIEIKLNKTKIQKVKENSWIILSPNEQVLKITCNTGEQYQRIKGAYFLTTNEVCQFHLNEKVLQTHHKEIKLQEILRLPHIVLTNSTIHETKIQLENINLDALNNIENKMHTITDFTLTKTNGISTRPSWISLTTIICVLSIFIYFMYKKHNIKCRRTEQPVELAEIRRDLSSTSQPPSSQEDAPMPLQRSTPAARLILGMEELHQLNPRT